jgi:integrase
VPILTDSEIAALLKTCAVGRGRPGTFARPIFFGRRDEVILRLLLDTGVRVSELCGLTLEDVDLDREVAYVPLTLPPWGAWHMCEASCTPHALCTADP